MIAPIQFIERCGTCVLKWQKILKIVSTNIAYRTEHEQIVNISFILQTGDADTKRAKLKS